MIGRRCLISRCTPHPVYIRPFSPTRTHFHANSLQVNVVAWSPHEVGCLLACASSDGNVSVLEFDDNRWEHKIFPAHGIGVNAVSWAPALYPSALFTSSARGGGGGSQQAPVRRFVTGGSDNLVKIWDWRYVLHHLTSPLTLLILDLPDFIHTIRTFAS